MPLFICRWPNGDFSAVSAASREEAVELLDEVANADDAELFSFKNFMVHFHLNKEADTIHDPLPVQLEGFGEGTFEMLLDRVYPVYDKALDRVFEDWPAKGEVPKEKLELAIKILNEALVTERTRKWYTGTHKLSDDPEVAQLQNQHDVPKTMAEKMVEERRRRAMTEMPSESDKVQ